MSCRGVKWLRAGALGPALAVALNATAAAPCEPPASGLSASVPTDVALFPANGIVLLSGIGLSLDGIEATVDGQKVSLLPVHLPHLYGYAALEASLQPQPKAGQAVVLSGTFCAPGASCPKHAVHFTATAADMVAPPPPTSVQVEIHDYADFRSNGGDCQSDSDLAYWVHIASVEPATGEAPVLYDVAALGAPELSTMVASHIVLATGTETTVGFRLLATDLGGKLPASALCFRVTPLDAAGNLTLAFVDACPPCHERVDAPGTSPFPPDEPAWTAADVAPSGACGGGGAAGAGGAGGRPPSSGGSGGAGGAAPTGHGTNVVNGTSSGCSCTLPGSGSVPGTSAALGRFAWLGLVAAAGRRLVSRHPPVRARARP